MGQEPGLSHVCFLLLPQQITVNQMASNNTCLLSDSSFGQNSEKAWLGPLFRVSEGRNQGFG